jgi:uncharacterized protein
MYAINGGYFLYILFGLPALLLGLWAQFKVKSAYNKYSKIRSYIGLSGAEVARRILDNNGLQDVPVEETQGILSDNYDPRRKVLRLSSQVYRSNSIAAAGVASHESGHAIQDQQRYFPLKFRSAIVPGVQLGSWLGPIIFIVGMLLNTAAGTQIATLGLIIFSLTAIFAVITLPVEFNASHRAKASLVNSGLIVGDEIKGVDRVLDAAALTYVAAAVQAISTVLYYATLLTGRRRR